MSQYMPGAEDVGCCNDAVDFDLCAADLEEVAVLARGRDIAGSSLAKKLFGRPPAWARKVEVAVIMGVFADAFDVEPPALQQRSADESLTAFREFTAACIEVALVDEQVAAAYRTRLGAGGLLLGSQLRTLLRVSPRSAFPFAQFLYCGIGIELTRDETGGLKFGPCSFAQRYSSSCCWFMSAFDEGFLRGLFGTDARLVFSCRLTEGAPCCRAAFDLNVKEKPVAVLPELADEGKA